MFDNRHRRVLAAGGPTARWAAGATVAAGAAIAALWWPTAALVVIATTALALAGVRGRRGSGLQGDQIERLHRAELALAGALSTQAAASELADHALVLLGAPSATVVIEGIGDTVRVTAGDPGSLYGPGSRMRLLDDAGLPCGSIAVSARADGRAYTPTQELILDALAQRISSTLHRLSLFASVQAERATLADVFESSSDGIFTSGADLLVRTWNPAMEAITGTPAQDALGVPVGAVFRPEAEDGSPRHGSADPGRGSTARTELVSVTARGEPRWLLCSWSPLREGGYVVVARDDTERKKLADDKDGWIAQVSHELRTPLTPIKGFLHTLARRDAEFTSADRARIYDVMLREEQRLEDLVTSLLRATSLSRPGPAPEPALVDLGPLIEEQAADASRCRPSIEVALRVDEEPVVRADRELTGAAVSGLLSNAVKFSPDRTTVRVHAGREGDEVVVTVTDEGPGVPPSDRERIFDKFTRLGDHLTRGEQGVGLGLYIARQAARRVGGEVMCVEPPGSAGACFRLSLPLAAVDQPDGGRTSTTSMSNMSAESAGISPRAVDP